MNLQTGKNNTFYLWPLILFAALLTGVQAQEDRGFVEEGTQEQIIMAVDKIQNALCTAVEADVVQEEKIDHINNPFYVLCKVTEADATRYINIRILSITHFISGQITDWEKFKMDIAILDGSLREVYFLEAIEESRRLITCELFINNNSVVESFENYVRLEECAHTTELPRRALILRGLK